MWARSPWRAAAATTMSATERPARRSARLSVLETEADVAWAEDWIATCFELQAGKRTAPRSSATRSIGRWCCCDRPDDRDPDAFRGAGAGRERPVGPALLHARRHARSAAGRRARMASPTRRLTVFEIEELMAMGERSLDSGPALPVPPLRAVAEGPAGLSAAGRSLGDARPSRCSGRRSGNGSR